MKSFDSNPVFDCFLSISNSSRRRRRPEFVVIGSAVDVSSSGVPNKVVVDGLLPETVICNPTQSHEPSALVHPVVEVVVGHDDFVDEDSAV